MSGGTAAAAITLVSAHGLACAIVAAITVVLATTIPVLTYLQEGHRDRRGGGTQTVIRAGAIRVVMLRPAAGNACRALAL